VGVQEEKKQGCRRKLTTKTGQVNLQDPAQKIDCIVLTEKKKTSIQLS